MVSSRGYSTLSTVGRSTQWSSLANREPNFQHAIENRDEDYRKAGRVQEGIWSTLESSKRGDNGGGEYGEEGAVWILSADSYRLTEADSIIITLRDPGSRMETKIWQKSCNEPGCFTYCSFQDLHSWNRSGWTVMASKHVSVAWVPTGPISPCRQYLFLNNQSSTNLI